MREKGRREPKVLTPSTQPLPHLSPPRPSAPRRHRPHLQQRRAGRQVQASKARQITFGLAESADYRAVNIERDGVHGTRFSLRGPMGELSVTLRLAGDQHVSNALASLAVAIELGVDPAEAANAVARVAPGTGRGSVSARPRAGHVVDDSYNANPASVLAALETLQRAGVGGRRVAALGDMLELGTEEVRLHKEIGERASELKLDLLVGAGALMANAVEAAQLAGVQAHSTPDSEAAGRLLHTLLEPGDVLLLKGSRGMRMERVLDSLRSGPEGNQ